MIKENQACDELRQCIMKIYSQKFAECQPGLCYMFNKDEWACYKEITYGGFAHNIQEIINAVKNHKFDMYYNFDTGKFVEIDMGYFNDYYERQQDNAVEIIRLLENKGEKNRSKKFNIVLN